jgi:hypothetical protein
MTAGKSKLENEKIYCAEKLLPVCLVLQRDFVDSKGLMPQARDPVIASEMLEAPVKSAF